MREGGKARDAQVAPHPMEYFGAVRAADVTCVVLLLSVLLQGCHVIRVRCVQAPTVLHHPDVLETVVLADRHLPVRLQKGLDLGKARNGTLVPATRLLHTAVANLSP